MANITPVGISVRNEVVKVKWNDGSETVAIPDQGDRFDAEIGALWALCKGFISISQINKTIYTATEFLDMTEGEMLHIVATKFLPERTVLQVVEIAKKSR